MSTTSNNQAKEQEDPRTMIERKARVETLDWFYTLARKKIREHDFKIKAPEALKLAQEDPATGEYIAKQLPLYYCGFTQKQQHYYYYDYNKSDATSFFPV